MVLPSTWMLRVANSTPIVLLLSKLNSFLVNRASKLLFPTPESPINTTVCVCVCVRVCVHTHVCMCICSDRHTYTCMAQIITSPHRHCISRPYGVAIRTLPPKGGQG